MSQDQPTTKDAPVSEAGSHGDETTGLWARLPPPLAGLAAAAAAIPLTALATIIGTALVHVLPQQSVALVYLLAVMASALAFGTRTGLIVAFLAFLADNFFFIAPLYTFTIADPQELFALFVFLAVALITGSLAGRMRQTAASAWQRAHTLQALNDFAATLSGARDTQAILTALATQAGATIRGNAVVLLADETSLQLRASTPDAAPLEPNEVQAAERAFRSDTTLHAAAAGWSGPRYEFQVLRGANGPIGAVGLSPLDGQRRIAMSEHSTLQTLFRHASIAIERTHLERETVIVRDAAEREHLRSALLSSVSHDLRTPLASILGAATSLRELGGAMTAEMRTDLLSMIEEEAERLSRFVSNLLEMTRLETAVDITHDWVDIGDAAQVAARRARRLFPNALITLDIEPGLPSIRGDAMLVEHVVFNLLDNGVKFSSGTASVAVEVARNGDHLVMTISDQGRGIPPGALQRVFDIFHRVNSGSIPGTGLGLTICKKIIEGMGGTIVAESPVAHGHGTRIVARVPVAAKQTAPVSVTRSAR